MAKKKLTKAQQTAQGITIIVVVIVIALIVGIMMQLVNYDLKFDGGIHWEPKVGVSNVGSITIDNGKPETLTFRVSVPSGMDGVQFRISRFKNFMWIGQSYQTASGLKQVGGLSGGKTYYVQVRSYKKGVLGRKVFGAWSGIKQKLVREKK
ncbi:MAG: hypothetical protein K6F00_08595 [Lachnospiraceae bacterium]|nr:hypothetical protein [Lachnospiraceae bacterium]